LKNPFAVCQTFTHKGNLEAMGRLKQIYGYFSPSVTSLGFAMKNACEKESNAGLRLRRGSRYEKYLRDL